MEWAATNSRPASVSEKQGGRTFVQPPRRNTREGISRNRKKRELRLLRSFLLLALLSHLGHVRDPLNEVVVGRWSAERRGLSPWARPLTVNEHDTVAYTAQVKNPKNAYISVT